MSIFKIKRNLGNLVNLLLICFPQFEFGRNTAHLLILFLWSSDVMGAIKPNFIEARKVLRHHYQLITLRVFERYTFIQVKSVPYAFAVSVSLPKNKVPCLAPRVVVLWLKRIVGRRGIKFHLEMRSVEITSKAVFHVVQVLPICLYSWVQLLLKYFRITGLIIERWF